MGIDRAALAPSGVASRLFRLDRLGVLVPRGHRFADLDAVRVEALAREPPLSAEEMKAPEFNQFTVVACAKGMSERLGWLDAADQATS